MIVRMVINDVETEFGFRTFVVDAETLSIHYPEEYRKIVSETQVNDFFSLACQYLEEYGDDVVSTDNSKLDFFE